MEDLLTLLESALGESEAKSHGNYRFKCPIPGCTSVRKRLEVQIDTDEHGHNPWKCWVCLQGGLSIKSLFRKAKIDSKYYHRLNKIITIKGEHIYQTDEIISLPDEFKTFTGLKKSDFVGRQALSYLRKRGFTDELILKYQLGYCESGKYAHRIIFPSFDSDGFLNYFAARAIIEDEEQRYIYPPSKRGDIIPFELYINWNAPIILCEGFFDAAAILRNVIPLLEKGITQALLSKLLGPGVEKIYIVLDKDGMKEALQHAEMLLSNGKTVYLVELDAKDPSNMGFESFTRFIQQAKVLTLDSLFTKKLKFSLYE
jgi:DNA primase